MYYTNQKIIQLIKECGFSQKEFAEKIGTTPAVVSKWVNGKKNPNMDSLKNICEKLDIPFSYFQESYNDTDETMMIFNDLAVITAINNYLSCFHYSIKQESPEDANQQFTLRDGNNNVIREFSYGELSSIIYEINQTINEKLFYSHRRNYLRLKDLAPINTIN